VPVLHASDCLQTIAYRLKSPIRSWFALPWFIGPKIRRFPQIAEAKRTVSSPKSRLRLPPAVRYFWPNPSGPRDSWSIRGEPVLVVPALLFYFYRG
jgi:hypothetical protein